MRILLRCVLFVCPSGKHLWRTRLLIYKLHGIAVAHSLLYLMGKRKPSPFPLRRKERAVRGAIRLLKERRYAALSDL